MSAPSNGPGGSRPSPGATDPRVAAMRATREFRAGAAFMIPEEARDDFLAALLVAADAKDPLRQLGMVRVDTGDEATVERGIAALHVCTCPVGANQHGPWWHQQPTCPAHGDAEAKVRAVLAALTERGEHDG